MEDCPYKVDNFQTTGDIFLSFQRGDAVVVLSQFGSPTVSSHTIDGSRRTLSATHICDTIHSGDGDSFCSVPYVLMPLGRTQGDKY